jgi:glutamine amidotransferase
MIVILDYGMGNIGSIQNMLKKIGEKNVAISHDEKIVRNADKIILPGVGSFDMGMSRLSELGLTELISDHVNQGKPILGICLGMQLLGKSSAEGSLPGLNLIPFDCKHFNFPDNPELKIPHMGWDRTYFAKDSHLTSDIESPQRYYYVHSYYAVCDSSENELMYCAYGSRFTAAVVKDHVYGVQFHPEKSHNYGMKLLKNFAERC